MYPYTLRRSKKRRTLSMKVKHTGEVIVYAPEKTPDSAIRDFIFRHEEWLHRAVERAKHRLEKHPPLTEAEIRELKKRAHEILPRRLAYWSERMNLYPKRVRITSAQTRFGSYSSSGTLSLSYRLLRYPPEAIDYVLVHELAHIREMNHGPRFYQLIEYYLPDYKERARILKNE